MIRISPAQLDVFCSNQHKAFVEVQVARLSTWFSADCNEVLPPQDELREFVSTLVHAANVAGIGGAADLEVLLDTCLWMGWTTPTTRLDAGVSSILEREIPSGSEKVTIIVKTAVFLRAGGSE